jgi:hypothetical protein
MSMRGHLSVWPTPGWSIKWVDGQLYGRSLLFGLDGIHIFGAYYEGSLRTLIRRG